LAFSVWYCSNNSGDWGQRRRPLCNLAGPLLDLLAHCEIRYLQLYWGSPVRYQSLYRAIRKDIKVREEMGKWYVNTTVWKRKLLDKLTAIRVLKMVPDLTTVWNRILLDKLTANRVLKMVPDLTTVWNRILLDKLTANRVLKIVPDLTTV
jgi:hypothetical protein